MNENNDKPGNHNPGSLPPIASFSQSFESSAETGMPPSSTGIQYNPKPNLKMSTRGYVDVPFKRTLPPPINRVCGIPSPFSSLRNVPEFSPPSNVSSTQDLSETQRRNVRDAVEQCKTLIPRITQAGADYFGGVLVDVLKETEDEVLLEDFFRLLYTVQPAGYCPLITSLNNPSYQFSPLEAKSRGLALCRVIHDTFMDPVSASRYFGMDTEKFFSTKVNAHEFHRVFLAAKVLTHCVMESHEPHDRVSGLSKASIFNIYQVYMYRLFSANSSTIERARSPETFFLSQQSMGKLMKILFTKASSRRLGKRGNSKYHFTGVAWRESALDDDIRRLIKLKPNQVKQTLQNMIQKVEEPTERPVKILAAQESGGTMHPSVPVSLLSYVSWESTFPDAEFAPRVRKVTPGKIPQQPEWWRNVMVRSIDALKAYNVHLEQPIEDFQTSEFSAELVKRIISEVLCAEENLHQKCVSEDGYLHLQLTVLMLVFPVVLASDEEISPVSKKLFCGFLRELVKVLEERGSEGPQFDMDHRSVFVSNVRKLIHISEAISVALPKEFASDIPQVLVDIALDLQKESGVQGNSSALDSLCARSAVIMFNAYPSLFPTSEEAKIGVIHGFVDAFRYMISESKTSLLRILADINSGNANFKLEGVRFAMFKQFIEVLHNSIHQKAIFLKTPMLVLKVSLGQLDRQIQAMNLQAFGSHHPELATEMFKTWWLITAAFYEYFNIISEVTALSQRFD